MRSIGDAKKKKKFGGIKEVNPFVLVKCEGVIRTSRGIVSTAMRTWSGFAVASKRQTLAVLAPPPVAMSQAVVEI